MTNAWGSFICRPPDSITHTATLPPTGSCWWTPSPVQSASSIISKLHHFAFPHLAVCVWCCFFFLFPVCLLSYISLLSLSSCVAFQERKAQMRKPISSVAPPRAAAAPPLAEPGCDQRLARPFTCHKNFKVYAAKRTLLYALICPRRCVKCLLLSSVIYLST